MPMTPLDDLRCPAPCGERLRVDMLRAEEVRGHAAGYEATLVCPRCRRRHDVADADRVDTVRFKMLVAGALMLLLGLPAAYFGLKAADAGVRIGAGAAVVACSGWFAASLVAFSSARARARRLASLLDASKPAATAEA